MGKFWAEKTYKYCHYHVAHIARSSHSVSLTRESSTSVRGVDFALEGLQDVEGGTAMGNIDGEGEGWIGML